MLVPRDVNNEGIVSFIRFPMQALEPTDPPEVTIHLWNNKGGSCEKSASDIFISVVNADKNISGGSNYEGQEIIDDDLVQAKSDGVEGSGIVDDAQASWTPIGKTSYLSVGNIPTNCARKIHFRLMSEAGTLTTRALFFLKIRYDYARTQAYLYLQSTNDHIFAGDRFYGGWFF